MRPFLVVRGSSKLSRNGRWFREEVTTIGCWRSACSKPPPHPTGGMRYRIRNNISMRILVDLEHWEGSPVVRMAGRDYARKPAAAFRDEAAGLTDRQAVFYRNLISIASALKSGDIPVDFETRDGTRCYLDRGCIKIAEHAGFISALADDANGTVSTIRLAWAVGG